jgi:thioredoxin
MIYKEMSMTENLTKETFLKKVFDYEKEKEWRYNGDLPAIIDFWAPWCGPCRMVGPVLEKIAEEYAGKLVVYKVNTDEEQELAGAFGIQSIPSILFIPLNGQPQMAVGALPKATIVDAIKDVLGVEAA